LCISTMLDCLDGQNERIKFGTANHKQNRKESTCPRTFHTQSTSNVMHNLGGG
jgi:hypothetical protein